MVAPMAMPATLKPFIADTTTIKPMVPMARPPRTGPNQTWNMRYKSSAMPDSAQYEAHVDEHRQRPAADTTSLASWRPKRPFRRRRRPTTATPRWRATAPMAAKTRWPVSSIAIIDANISSAISS